MLGAIGFYQVPQGHAVVLERFGKFEKVLPPGLTWVNPLVSTYKNLSSWQGIASKCNYLMELTEQQLETDMRSCNTKDNVTVRAQAIINFKIINPEKAVYAIDILPLTIQNVCLNVLRSQIGTYRFDDIFAQRSKISANVKAELDAKVKEWGVELLNVEVGELEYDQALYTALQQKRIAEAKKDAKMTEIEAAALSGIKEMEGQLQAKTVEAKIKKMQVESEAEATKLRAEAEGKSVEIAAQAQANAYRANKQAERQYLDDLIKQVGKEQAIHLITSQRTLEGMTTFTSNPSNKVIMLPNDFKGMIKLASLDVAQSA